MKKFILPILLAAAALSSCNSNKYATTGKGTYETDEVYYQPSDTYISDFALVDDEAQMAEGDQATSSVPSVKEDEYYSGDNSSTQNGNTTNNYYGNVYQSPWGYDYGNSYGGYGYGSYNCWPGSRYNLGWDPWNGWYFSFNFGYNWGCNPYYNPYYAYGNGWYSPYYNPWYYNQWGYNTWYSPYNYYNPYYGYNNPYYGGYWGGNYWNDDSDYAGVIFGHRNPLATGTLENSTYGDDLFYTGRELKPTEANQPVLAMSPAMTKPAALQTAVRPSMDANPANIGLNTQTPIASDRKPVSIGSENAGNDDYVTSTQKPGRDVQTSTDVNTPEIVTNNGSNRPRPTYVTSTRPEMNSNSSQSTYQNNGSGTQGTRPVYESREPVQQSSGGVNTREPSRAPTSAPQMKMPPMNTPERETPRQPEKVQTPSRDNKPSRDLNPSRDNKPSTPSINHDAPTKAPSGGGNSGRSVGGGGNNSGGSRSGGNSGGGSVSGPRRK